jgi:hypothetical protein
VTTPLNALKDAISTLWAATTPPDRPEVSYARITGRTQRDGGHAGRCFWFEPSRRLRVESQAVGPTGPMVSYVRWEFRPVLRLSASGRGIDDLEEAIANEANLLVNRIAAQGDAWRPTGVLDVQTDGEMAVEIDTDSGDALVELQMSALCAETDGS